MQEFLLKSAHVVAGISKGLFNLTLYDLLDRCGRYLLDPEL